MFGMQELKEELEKGADTIECPIKRCENRVKRMRGRGTVNSLGAFLVSGEGKKEQFDQYFCEDHGIYITPTTFIYKDLKDNLLWYDGAKELFDEIIKVKRVKAQLHHDNSEDAVTWNVFTFLEKSKLLSGFLEELCHFPVGNLEAIYWSYSQSQHGAWDELRNARKEFGESERRGTEPDLIVKTDKLLLFIEAKLKSTNKTDFNRGHTSVERKERINRYNRGSAYLESSVENIIDAGYYQLMRLWLIGANIAENGGQNFYLLTIVRNDYERDVALEFGKYIRQDGRAKFIRVSWEDIHDYVLTAGKTHDDKDKILRYFRHKTIGYEEGILQRAFSVV
jgi:hypothetical protein